MSDNKQTLINLFLNSDDNICFTISSKELRMFLQEIVRQEIDKDKAAEAARNADETMTQAQVCKFLGVSKSTLWRWERDNYLSPTGRMGRSPLYLKSDVECIKKGM